MQTDHTTEMSKNIPADLPDAIRDFVLCTNAGDSNGVLECFTLDAVLSDGDQKYQGRAELAAWDQNDNVGVQSQLTIITWAVFFQGFRVTVKVAGKGFTGTGEMNFQLLDGKIALLSILEAKAN
ncbi:hypothetical protein QFZ34_001376 [Phyllobacterium ifriqiyense]|uniref:Nuclear transport factor 2 family protein n=1 Tax=Phyllobacterium ifriqiyense TaxID=314238 RepID=A0ABU0S607_9HYPH|nr:nuclear transport factor 2 family protein [Phyllobacterium ifriqiyense]MDQ0996199.1 hypothetical protein [Phyllobacterium ifriqiyense]